ncbi:apoptotic protease-activating factor 1 isoform X1 [Amyelois transitella]|uniref:apoptotic protease-activating factor 1 isoform X1 n=1 Tax=Amyelois transitella TaxID=680683 RepID=UPI00298F6824|nr:apoptotic protease-activating factor 1 isoform X1 [Amyelois transitella]XP_013193138.2 apoptotic protease-activating factor 1 isoform X1 [Amyelois transitella]XP_060801367.1 apoptotic protease-activating factor 1 isoform X1 [Amyelois transitella]
MDYRKKLLLQSNRTAILQDLEVADVIDQLLTSGTITVDDMELMETLPSRIEKTKHLLDLIENSTDNAFQAFLDCLKKDYEWLWTLLSGDTNTDVLNTSIEDNLSKGDVPRLPQYYVRRPLVEKNVLHDLKKLSRHKALVLLGTIGSGKTTIAISVIRNNPDLVSDSFNGKVFWLNCSNCKNDYDITALQNKLQRKTSLPSYSLNSSISIPSISSIGDTSISGYERSWEESRDVLKEIFSNPVLSGSLLVLDEVNERGCVDAFDIGCKILITTREKSVYGNLDAEVISIDNHLNDNEILALFASCLRVPVTQLPRQAKKLQEACKGKSPFHLALIGAQLAENRESLTDTGTPLWKHYINNIEKKTFFSIFNNEKPQKPEKVMKFCLSSLENDTFNLFKMLTILPDNTKVSAKVLSKLWHRNEIEVQSILRKLKNKSLINECYDKDHKVYKYETHEIILDYLKGCSTDEEKHKWHSDFLKSYQYNNPSDTTVDIVDDGYIAFFIGYHLENTHNVDDNYALFNRLFLDLRFLGNKVRLTGQADVIYDLQNYENYIVAHPLDKDLLISIVAFLKTYGTDLYRYQCTDIIQSILQHETKGVLYKKAYDVAQENVNTDELYFDFSDRCCVHTPSYKKQGHTVLFRRGCHEHNIEEIIPSTIDVKETITSCCFQYDYVLIGTQKGNVKIFYLNSNKLKGEIAAARCPIKWIGACPIKPSKVAVLSSDGDIQLWTIKEEDTCTIEEESEEHQSYTPSLNSSIQINPSIRPCVHARWAETDNIILTQTNRTIALNNTDGQLIQLIDVDRNDGVICCSIFSDKFIVAAVNNNGAHSVLLIDNITQKQAMSIDETDRIINLIVVPGTNKIITLKDKEVTQHNLKINYSNFQNRFICKSEKVISSDDIKEKLTFLSMAVNKSGTMLFVSTCDQRVKCIDLNTNRAFDIENRRGNVITMDVSEIQADDDFLPGVDVLLTGTGGVENSAKVWFLDASYVSLKRQQIENVRLTKRFDVSFANTLSPITPTLTSESISNCTTPRRNQSFAERTEPVKKPATKALSLDRFSLKLNLKGACNNNDGVQQPLLAVVDDTNNIQLMRGRKLLTKIPTNADDQVNVVTIFPCNQYIIYGLRSGHVIKYTVRTKEKRLIMDLGSPIQYLNFVKSNLLIVAGENRCIMAYEMLHDGAWESKMMQKGSCLLGSTEMLNDLQGVKKKNGHSDSFSDSGSTSTLSDSSTLVDSFWIPDVGLITVEINAVVKLWDKTLKLDSVLNATHPKKDGVRATCAACKKSILVICDAATSSFQVFHMVKEDGKLKLTSKGYQQASSAISACELCADGSKLALGTDSGAIEIWNVSNRNTRVTVLRHHKSRVSSVAFSPVPERSYRSSVLRSPSIPHPQPQFPANEEPPLVLVSMAAEIVWWNVSFILTQPTNRNSNVVSPLLSPIDNRSDTVSASSNNNNISQNIFFGNGCLNTYDCWKSIWKRKRCKKGSKRQEILACIKLSGMNAKRLIHNEEFSCFVTVDNSGHIHIMNVMQPNT